LIRPAAGEERVCNDQRLEVASDDPAEECGRPLGLGARNGAPGEWERGNATAQPARLNVVKGSPSGLPFLTSVLPQGRTAGIETSKRTRRVRRRNGGEVAHAIKTLVFAGGEIHDYRAVGAAVRGTLEAAHGFDVTYVEEDLDVLTRLDPYDLLVFHYTMGTISPAQREGLLTWAASGKGFVGVHSAADSFRGSPDYRAFVGGHFVTHPKYRQYQVSIVDSAHPVTEGLDEFFVTDEQYILDYDPRVYVLATALWKGTAMPVAWTKSWGEGRVFYLALGHDGPACEHEMFKLLLTRGARWAGAFQG
jgi:type 1 glutamine amidotransferase